MTICTYKKEFPLYLVSDKGGSNRRYVSQKETAELVARGEAVTRGQVLLADFSVRNMTDEEEIKIHFANE